MSELPNMWRDQDEFSKARRAKYREELMRSVEQDVLDRPEPKDQKPSNRTAADVCGDRGKE